MKGSEAGRGSIPFYHTTGQLRTAASDAITYRYPDSSGHSHEANKNREVKKSVSFFFTFLRRQLREAGRALGFRALVSLAQLPPLPSPVN